MRPLTEEETRTFFEKLANYLGRNIKFLVDRADEEHCFRLHKDKVYYLSVKLLKAADSFSRDELISMGTCFGKFTKTRKFRLHITCLEYLAAYAKFKVWIKPSGVMPFLYGNNVLKAHLGRITENTPKYQGVVFYSMSDMPLGFGRSAQSTADCRKLDPTAVVAFHQADVGEYLREEDSLFVKQATASKQRQSGSLLSTELTKSDSSKKSKSKRKGPDGATQAATGGGKRKKKKDHVPVAELTSNTDLL
jgi:60S ribosome subunit biogenesis protein NIP7